MKRPGFALLAVALLGGCLLAQISAPTPGFVRLPGLPIQVLFGVPGSFITAAGPFGTAQAASFSDTRGLLAQDGRIRLVTRGGSAIASFPYTGPPPLLDLAPDSALAWLPASHTLLWWDGRVFTPLPISPGDLTGQISDVSVVSPDNARFLLTHPDRTVSSLLVSLANGAVLSSDVLPGVQGPAFQFGAHLLWADGKTLHIESSGAAPQTLPAPPGPFTAERMSAQWIHLFFPAAGIDCALHLDNAAPTLSRLPAVPGGTRP